MNHHLTKAAEAAQAKETFLAGLSVDVVYLMGVSFILGSLITIFILLLLDFMKRDRVAPEND